MLRRVRRLIHTYLPANFHDPVGLALKLVRSGDPAAILAMNATLLGVVLTPIDLLLQPLEARAYEKAPPPQHPLLLVCGPPRSGTTVVAQTLIRNLELGYLNNLTSIFPRSPIMANRLLGWLIGNHQVSYRSYYGKSEHLSGPNDALYIWDRWAGKDRTRIPGPLSELAARQMRQFFAAYEQLLHKPVLNKNNSLNTFASTVGDALPNAHFICMQRDPLFLAQALLIARTEIHNDPRTPYGIHPPGVTEAADPVESVCRQVLFFEQMAREQQAHLGSDRFWIVPYEQFCENPARLVFEVSEKIFGRPMRAEQVDPSLRPFKVSRKVRLEPEVFGRLERTLEQLRADAPELRPSIQVYA